MIKITDIEALLNLKHEADIDLWSVDLKIIHELENLYSLNAEYSKKINNHWLTLNSGNVTLTLNTMKKTKSEATLPKVDLEFLNIKH